jgi:hypothetical protein
MFVVKTDVILFYFFPLLLCWVRTLRHLSRSYNVSNVSYIEITPSTALLFFVVVVVHFTCAYIIWVTSPSWPPPSPFPLSPSQFQAGPVLPLSLILLKKRHKDNKEDKVELRIAIQRDSYYCFRISMCYNPCWFNSNWSIHCFLIPSSW